MIAGMGNESDSRVTVIGNDRVAVRRISGDAGRPVLVFLHEGLGSIGM